MKKVIKISESKLRQMVTEAVMEAVNGGWEVDDSEAMEAYNLAVNTLGKEVIDDAIIRAMSSHTLAELLAYIFRQYDFREWDEYKSSKSEEHEIYEDKNDFEPAKYQGKWSVYDKTSRTYSNIGVGKKNAVKKAEELNKPSDEK